LGNFFDPGSSVSLVQGTTVIAGTNVTINQNGTELSASADLSVVPFGLYDVEIVEPSGLTEILPAAFEIMPSAMAYIPEGSFEMGDHKNTPNPDEQPIHDVTVANDIVTQVGGIMATVCNLAPTALDSCISWNGTSFEVSVGNEDKPVVETSWFGGALYANYLSASEGKGRVYHPLTWVINYNSDGYRMPTEAEWEYAARGSYRYLRFPWGGTIDADDCNYNNNIGDVTNVGSYPYNGYGLYDMSGNVFERCNDWYDANYYAVSPGSNPTGPSSSTSSGRVQRGGSFRGSQDQVRCANRGYDGAEATHNHVGIRLVLPIQ
jgi:formylglycine-generating enzyme required for sulfatase activity